MKNGCVVANAGHFNVEINIPALKSMAEEKHRPRPNVDEYLLGDGRRIRVLSEGRLVNLAFAEGHPATVMDMSFANQALCAVYLLNNASDLDNKVHLVPLEVDPIDDIVHFSQHGFSLFFGKLRCWSKSEGGSSDHMRKRFRDLKELLGVDLQITEGLSEGPLSFSRAVPHGESGSTLGTLMMTRIEMGPNEFVHASDIQLLDDPTVDQVIDWEPDIVLAAGPPLYLERLSISRREQARCNAVRLARSIDTVILDHHLMRSIDGTVWLHELCAAVGKKVYCAADFMGRPRQLLEAERARLYEEMPVPEKWHDAYALGQMNPDNYIDDCCQRVVRFELSYNWKSR
jgi:hypothetical protein